MHKPVLDLKGVLWSPQKETVRGHPVWLLSLPFRLIGITFEAVFALLKAPLFLPARALGHRG